MFENFPYTDMHQLNLDWIIKIAKDFLDQYTHIQQLITDGETALDNKAAELTALLDEWYNTHSEDIANELATALDEIAADKSSALSDIASALSQAITTFQNTASAAGEAVIESIPEEYTRLSNDVVQLKNENGMTFYVTTGYINTAGRVNPGPERYYTDFIPCMENASIEYISENNHAYVNGISFYDINKTFILGYANNGTLGSPVTVTSPANTAYCRISTKLSILDDSYVKIPNGSLSDTLSKLIVKTAFISPTGDDTNGYGTQQSPYQTVNHAMAMGANRIMVLQGRYYQTVDFNNAKHNYIEIISRHPGSRAIFCHPDSFVTDTETQLSGYTKVYYAAYTGSIRTDIRLYQEDYPDLNTRITDTERNPYQRGQVFRCLDTPILPCTSTTLNAALSEIENSDNYLYFNDEANNTIYFSRPIQVRSSYPIMRSVHTATFFTNQFRGIEVNLVGIEVKYMRFNVSNMVATLTDCKSANVFGTGGFIYDWSIAKFIRCEAAGIYYADGAGDGFNAHSTTGGDPWSKQTTGLLIDCWSHDCQDDGFSDHECCESEVWGGLFEYNGKGGITPSHGSHCSCYNVLSRRNNNGFWYLGVVTQAEGGKGGQIMCIGCIAEENHANGSGTGFCVSSAGNSGTLINCKAIGNDIGYSNGADCIINMTDCSAKDNTTVKQNDGLLYIHNTEPVT